MFKYSTLKEADTERMGGLEAELTENLDIAGEHLKVAYPQTLRASPAKGPLYIQYPLKNDDMGNATLQVLRCQYK